MEKIKISLVIFLAVILLSACGSQAEDNRAIVSQSEVDKQKEIIVMDELTSYNGYNSYQDALFGAETVVYGKIIEIGEPYVENYGDEKHVIKYYFTPIKLEVIEFIKGEQKTSTIIYEALGAEFDDVIYDYKAFDTLDYEIGDELLVFLSKRNQCISPQCAIGENENGIATKATLDQKMSNYSLSKHVELVKSAYSKMITDNKVTE